MPEKRGHRPEPGGHSSLGHHNQQHSGNVESYQPRGSWNPAPVEKDEQADSKKIGKIRMSTGQNPRAAVFKPIGYFPRFTRRATELFCISREISQYRRATFLRSKDLAALKSSSQPTSHP
jgi:hypothetical protein